jgi:hypothetical protein
MGSGFFGNVMHSITNPSSTIHSPFNPGAWRIGAMNNTGMQGPYAGVDASLKGANAGYGGAVQPGADPSARATPVNPYVGAIQPGKSPYVG